MRYILAISTALLLAAPAHAGGPVIVSAEEAPVVRDRNTALPLILLGLAVAAVVLGNGSDACNGDPEPTPEPGC
jgi:hypothetical protein